MNQMKKRGDLKVRGRRKSADWEYFDDCLICQATKKAEEEGKNLSVEELKEVFRKANETK